MRTENEINGKIKELQCDVEAARSGAGMSLRESIREECVALKCIELLEWVLNKPVVKLGDVLKLKGSGNYTCYAMVVELRNKYNTLVLPDNEYPEEDGYHLDNNSKDYDTIDDMISMYQKEFNAVEVITMQQYIDEVGNQND